MNTNIQRYLPSKKFLISLGILAGIVVIFFVVRLIAHKARTNTVDPSTIVVTNLMNPVEIDTDGDGVYDWEEALWGTDAKNPDSNADGISDGAEIARKKEALQLTGPNASAEIDESNLSETEKLARDIYTTIAIAAEGGINDEKSQEITNDIAKTIINKTPSEPTYSLGSLTVVPYSATTQAAYLNKMGGAFQYNEEIKQLLRTTTEQIKASSIDPVFFKASGDELATYAKNMSLVVVPEPAKEMHLLLTNSYDRIAKILIGLSQIETDPIFAFSYGIEYQDAIIDLSTAYANMSNYFASQER